MVPERAVGEALAEALARLAAAGARWSRAPQDGARRRARRAARAGGTEVDVVALYRTVAEPLRERGPRRGAGRRLADLRRARRRRASSTRPPARLDGPRLASIGPVTSAALRELGYEPALEAADHTPDGLVAALVSAAGRG